MKRGGGPVEARRRAGGPGQSTAGSAAAEGGDWNDRAGGF